MQLWLHPSCLARIRILQQCRSMSGSVEIWVQNWLLQDCQDAHAHVWRTQHRPSASERHSSQDSRLFVPGVTTRVTACVSCAWDCEHVCMSVNFSERCRLSAAAGVYKQSECYPAVNRRRPHHEMLRTRAPPLPAPLRSF